ncbi:hypothetical protein M2G92_22025 [Vibrio vulnificus]|nr:hypothetical protein [Vibrio vulnificus]MCU8317888.1 hypothetical protein [Vibrio vulnificus]
MKQLIIGFSILLSTFTINASELPEVLDNGFQAYLTQGPKAAITSWSQGGILEGSRDALAQANSFRKVEEYYGSYQGFEVFKSNKLSEKSYVYLVVLHYEQGPVFSKFFTYVNAKNKEVVTGLNFNTEAGKVWPSYLIYGE